MVKNALIWTRGALHLQQERTGMSLLRDTVTAAAWAGGALALGIGLALLAQPAKAGGFQKERVYDDSYGNLVVISPSGYKRIVVGMGYLAAEYQEQHGPKVVELDESGPHGPHCYMPPYLWKGRSYMYGLAEGEIPTPPRVCD
jgi:hypothetical protein